MSIPSVFGVKGMAVAAAIGCAAGAYASYLVTDAFGKAAVLRLENADLRKDKADQAARIAALNEQIASTARITAGVNTIAINVNKAIAALKETAPDEAVSSEPGGTYSDADFERVHQRIRRAAAAGAAIYPAAQPGDLGTSGGASAKP